MKTIIFDVYGTLVSTGNGSVEATEKILKKVQVDMLPKEFYREWKKIHRRNLDASNLEGFLTESEIFQKDLEELYHNFNIKGNAQDDVKFMLNSLGKRKAFEDVRLMLKRLKNSYQLVIGSTTDTTPLMQDIKRNHIDIKKIFTSEILEIYKPHKKFYLDILDACKCNAEDTFFVGDSMNDDVSGPKSVGMKAILIDRKNTYNEQDYTIKPDAIINSLDELDAVLEKLGKGYN